VSNREEIEKALAAAAEASKGALKEARELVTKAAHLSGRFDEKGRDELLATLQKLHLALDRIKIS
jgi:hypothetical protein